jgi:hypothetical protein
LKRNIQLLNTDLTLAQFEDLLESSSPTHAAPVKREGANHSSRGNAPSLFLIDVRPPFNWKRFRDGFLVGGLFIALLWVCAFLIIPWLAQHL